jgi:hypothetical protein
MLACEKHQDVRGPRTAVLMEPFRVMGTPTP